MRLIILKVKIMVYVVLMVLFISSCKKANLENQITVEIKSIDRESKKLRLNTFDTIEVRVMRFGYLTKEYVQVGQYVTDNNGSVKIKVDRSEENHFILSGQNVYGATEFSKNELKNGQIIYIDVIRLEKK